MKELDTEKGIGLIEKKRLGLGKSNVIYVKNFMVAKEESPLPEKTETPDDVENIEKAENKVSGDRNSGIVKITKQEFSEPQRGNCKNHNPEVVRITKQELPESQSNKTDINKTDFSETDLIHPYPSDVIGQMERYRNLMRDNISYGCYLQDKSCPKKELDELVELMVDVMMMPDYAALRIAGAEKPSVMVKERFLKLEYSHIAYVLGCLRGNTGKVGNIRAYLLL